MPEWGGESRAALQFDPGLAIRLRADSLAFEYGESVFGPAPELRRLNDIRRSLLDPDCAGPDPVYGIVMDVGERADAAELQRRSLLFGAVVYAGGRLGEEPVRSQGHVHAIAPHCGWSTPELFEIWEGRAIVYAQEFAADRPGRCIAVEAGPGEHVVVPPGWAHCVINANETERMVFGALCERQYGFVYDGVRAHGGLAWFPLIRGGGIAWQANPRYEASTLQVRRARAYPELGIQPRVPIYRQFQNDPDRLQWVSDPARAAQIWKTMEP
ncbi:MAG TPA: glucose-6-phosphate isomerase family protein [Acidobacteriaceae bacterium]|jgi:glucose-6-phosphate isomerase|nr:glucose-6-phosphate isomerase family protein [Acidobacteriaceae bacterium]